MTPQALIEDALVTLLLKWGGRSEEHVQAEARFTVIQFLNQYPAIRHAAQNERRLVRVWLALESNEVAI